MTPPLPPTNFGPHGSGDPCDGSSLLRKLTDQEVTILQNNGNEAQSWDQIRVAKGFDARQIKRCRFFGTISIGALKEGLIDRNGLVLPEGLYDSTFSDCSIGHFVAIHRLHFCSRCTIGNEVVIFDAGEIITTVTGHFKNGAIPAGESGLTHQWLHLINENGGRAVIPFNGMLCSDAYLWAKMRHDRTLMERLTAITDTTLEKKALICNGIIGDGATLKQVRSIQNSVVGKYAVIDTPDTIRNSTINSDDLEPTFIGVAVQVRDTITGFGNRIDSGTQLQSVITGSNVSISQAARITHSFIGDNSSISCCEIAHSLIFPSHGQHHNNSFLIASVIGGQSNIAAGATIGSNHNSRMNDGEIWASRGFWPGLCTSFKHNSRFASFTMCVKGDYPFELDIPYPFSLILNDTTANRLLILPAYWFTNNMYAIMRSRIKFSKRDRRMHREQVIEHDPLAPDTIEEMFSALRLLERSAGASYFQSNVLPVPSEEECTVKGRILLMEGAAIPDTFEIHNGLLEKGGRPVCVMKPAQAWQIYRNMIRWYVAKTIIAYSQVSQVSPGHLAPSFHSSRWINCGGQVWRADDLYGVIDQIKQDTTIVTWDDIHRLYQKYQNTYTELKLRHALSSLALLDEIDPSRYGTADLKNSLKKAIPLCKEVSDLTRASREKDFTDHFRRFIYDSQEEMDVVLGTLKDDQVVEDIEQEAEALVCSIKELILSLNQ